MLAPSYSNLPASPAGTVPPKDADDALSGLLIQRDVLKPGMTKSLSTIRGHIRSNLKETLEGVIRAGETPLDAANAIRARLGQRLVPKKFTLGKSLRAKGGFGTLRKGSTVRVTGATVRAGRLKITVSGQTAQGRHVTNDVDEDVIGRLF